MIDAEPPARAAEPADDLVRDQQQHAEAVTDLADRSQVTGRRHDATRRPMTGSRITHDTSSGSLPKIACSMVVPQASAQLG